MNKTLNYLKTSADFITVHIEKIIIVIAIVAIFYLGYILTTRSLKKLKSDIFPYYPFDKFFPKSGKWSVVYFVITLILFGILIYFLTKGGFYLAPA